MTADGVALKSLYTEAAEPAIAQRTSGGWETLALLDPRRGEMANVVERARKFGAHGLWWRPGVTGNTPEGLVALTSDLEGLRLACAAGSIDADTALALLRDCSADTSLDLAWDPLSTAMAAEQWDQESADYQAASQLVAESPDDGQVTVLGCSSLALHAAGGDPVDELTLLAASWLEFLRRLDGVGADAQDVAAQTTFQLAAGGHLLTEIAKFRAARELLARTMVAHGVRVEIARAPIVHAVTSPRALAARGHRNNALRAVGQVAAAVLGGADRVTVLPWDDRLDELTPGSDRLALQTQNVLREEARLGELADPGAGSFAIDSLTDQLGRQAWQLLAEIEEEGGAGMSLRDGTLRRRLGLARQRRQRQIESRRQPVLGVNTYPDPHEPPEVLPLDSEGAYARFFDDGGVEPLEDES